MPTREFEPLMLTIQRVLEAIGDPAKLQDSNLREQVQQLKRQYDDYAACCCFRGIIIAPETGTTTKTSS